MCSGPRQVILAFILKSVYDLKLKPSPSSTDRLLSSFFKKLGALARDNHRQAIVLLGMCFTFLIWCFSALFLLASVLSYLILSFQPTSIPNNGLIGYCKAETNQRLMRMMINNMNQPVAISRDEIGKADLKTCVTMDDNSLVSEPCTAMLNIVDVKEEDSLPKMPTLSLGKATTVPTVRHSQANTPNSTETRLAHQNQHIHFGSSPFHHNKRHFSPVRIVSTTSRKEYLNSLEPNGWLQADLGATASPRHENAITHRISTPISKIAGLLPTAQLLEDPGSGRDLSTAHLAKARWAERRRPLGLWTLPLHQPQQRTRKITNPFRRREFETYSSRTKKNMTTPVVALNTWVPTRDTIGSLLSLYVE